ncbi:MAG: hypothetical protein ACKVP7_03045 [Hyphomicrobiaceae bacterium]
MKRMIATVSALIIGAMSLGIATEAAAGSRKRAEPGPYLTEHPKSTYYRKRSGPQVRGFVARRGGYSYTYGDSVNTYGDSRSLYGSTYVFRTPSIDRQTTAGPFDHGFFFDSGVTPRGGDSPYMH